MKKVIDLSIIIVNFNTEDLLKACLDSVFGARMKKDRWEVIVVDNNSTDGSRVMLEKYPHPITCIQNSANIGFAAANNKGILKSTGKYILLLNSDTEVTRDALSTMISFMDKDESIGASTCSLLLPDGTLDPACHRGFPSPWASLTYFLGLERLLPHFALFSGYHQWYKDLTVPHEIDCPSGAFFLVRRTAVDQAGLLDERFFMYAEDIDWAYRIKQLGFSVYFNPRVSVLHKKKQSGRASSVSELRKKTEQYFYLTMEQFYRKHYMTRYSPFVTGSILLLLRVRRVLLALTGV